MGSLTCKGCVSPLHGTSTLRPIGGTESFHLHQSASGHRRRGAVTHNAGFNFAARLRLDRIRTTDPLLRRRTLYPLNHTCVVRRNLCAARSMLHASFQRTERDRGSPTEKAWIKGKEQDERDKAVPLQQDHNDEPLRLCNMASKIHS